MKDKEKQIKFSVIDNKTGEYPDLYKIALKEEWAKGLMYCDMEGFSINEDGQLILSDECGKFVYCPSDRFTVVFEDSVVLSREEYEKLRSLYDCEQGSYMTSNIGDLPLTVEGLRKAEKRIAELEKEIEENAFYSKGYAQGIKNTYEVVIPEKLKQFAERLKEEFIKSANIQDSITAKKLFRDICPVKVEKILKKTLKEFICSNINN